MPGPDDPTFVGKPLNDAAMDAQTEPEAADPFGSPTDPDESDGKPVARRSNVPRIVMGMVGIAVMLGIGLAVVRALGGDGGGASSPEDAVRRLASAISNEDPVGVANMLAPDEVSTLAGLFGEIEARASSSGLGGPKKATSGIDLAIEDLDLDVDHLSDTVAKVEIRRGRLTWKVDEHQLGPGTQRAVGDIGGATGRIDPDDLTISSWDGRRGREVAIDPFVMVVRRSGGWYVSPAYTAAAYVAEANGLPAGNFDQEVPKDLPAASSPEEAVIELATSIDSMNPEEILEHLPEYEWTVLHTYQRAIDELIDDATADGSGFTFDLDDSDLKVSDLPGGYKRVEIISASGTASTRNGWGEIESADWDIDGWCLSWRGDQDRDRACMDDSDGMGDFVDMIDMKNPFVVVRPVRGGWAVSPVATLTQYGKDVLSKLTDNWLYRMADLTYAAEAGATLEPGGSAEVVLNEASFAVVDLATNGTERLQITLDGPDADDQAGYLVYVEGGRAAQFHDQLIATVESSSHRLVVFGEQGSTAKLSASTVAVHDLPADQHLVGSLDGDSSIVEYRFRLPEAGYFSVEGAHGDIRAEIISGEGGYWDHLPVLNVPILYGTPAESAFERVEGAIGPAEGAIGGGTRGTYLNEYQEHRVRISGSGSYDLTLSAVGATIDGSNRISEDLGSQQSRHHQISVPDDHHTVVTLTSPPGADFDLYCDSSNGSCGSSMRAGGPDMIEVWGPIDGTLEVYAYSGSGTYQLEISSG